MNLSTENKTVFDLSHEISPDISTFPVSWHKKVTFETLGRFEVEGRRTTQIHIGTHAGTHIDAPSHFIQDGLSIDKIEIEKFIGKAFVHDLSYCPEFYQVKVSDLITLGKSEIQNQILIFKFGWALNFGKDKYYTNQPFFSLEACNFILKLKPKIIGYDLAMPDNPLDNRASDCDSPAHKIFLGSGIPLIENLNLPKNLPKEISIACQPLKLRELDGSPIRCIGWNKD